MTATAWYVPRAATHAIATFASVRKTTSSPACQQLRQRHCDLAQGKRAAACSEVRLATGATAMPPSAKSPKSDALEI